METKNRIYKHIGFYNDIDDIGNLTGKSADEIINYLTEGLGHFYPDNSQCDCCDIYTDERFDEIEWGEIRFTSDGRFAVWDSLNGNWDGDCAKPVDGESNEYIDLYEIRNERDLSDRTPASHKKVYSVMVVETGHLCNGFEVKLFLNIDNARKYAEKVFAEKTAEFNGLPNISDTNGIYYAGVVDTTTGREFTVCMKESGFEDSDEI